jgi:hypothetical protein
MSDRRSTRTWGRAAILAALLVSVPGTLLAADPGANQPGAAGNAGAASQAKDPGANQPGKTGNTQATKKKKKKMLRDPGINQPGAAGNVGGPPGRAGGGVGR